MTTAIPPAITTAPTGARRHAHRDEGFWHLVHVFGDRLQSRRTTTGRNLTPREARMALAEVGELVAIIGLHLPVRSELVQPVLEAIDEVAGHEVRELELRVQGVHRG